MGSLGSGRRVYAECGRIWGKHHAKFLESYRLYMRMVWLGCARGKWRERNSRFYGPPRLEEDSKQLVGKGDWGWGGGGAR